MFSPIWGFSFACAEVFRWWLLRLSPHLSVHAQKFFDGGCSVCPRISCPRISCPRISLSPHLSVPASLCPRISPPPASLSSTLHSSSEIAPFVAANDNSRSRRNSGHCAELNRMWNEDWGVSTLVHTMKTVYNIRRPGTRRRPLPSGAAFHHPSCSMRA
jgi:hypothetical protein